MYIIFGGIFFMKKYKWYIGLSMTALLLGNVSQINAHDEYSAIVKEVNQDLVAHQVQNDDTVSNIADKLKLDAELLKKISDRSKFKLSQAGNWAILYKEQYLILADEHLHDYAVYDLKQADTSRQLPYTKINPTQEIKDLLIQLHEKIGHLDGEVHHHHDGHSHNHHDHHDHDHHDHHGHSHNHHDHHDHHGHSHNHHDHNHHDHHGHSHHNGHNHHAKHNEHNHTHDHSDHTHSHEHAYEFNPKDIVSEDELGYVIKHNDHYHFVPKNKDSNSKDNNSKENNSKENTPLNNQQENNKPETPKDDLSAKIHYIAITHGVPEHSIRVSNEYFVFSTPGHAYDPTHIHPIAILINRIIVPEVTGDPETDFENELRAISHLSGIPIHGIRIHEEKFVVPFEDHSHFLNITAKNGIKPYYDSQLPAINGAYVEGSLDLDAVKNKVTQLIQSAEALYQEQPKQLRRIKQALDTFSYQLNDLKTNSTTGYLQMLDAFDKQYINKVEVPQQNEEQTQVTDIMTTQQYNNVVDAIRNLDLNGYALSREDLIQRLKDNHTEADLDKMNNLIKEINHARPTNIYSMKYIDYLLTNIEQPTLTNDLRDEMLELIVQTYDSQFGGRQFTSSQLMIPLIETRIKVADAIATNIVNPERIDSEKFVAFTAANGQMSIQSQISRTIREIRDILHNFDSTYVPNITEEPTVTPSVTESSESQVSSDATSVESETAPTEVVDETPANTDSEVVNSQSSESEISPEAAPETTTPSTNNE